MFTASSKKANARAVRGSRPVEVFEGVAAHQRKSAAVGLALSAGVLMTAAPSVALQLEEPVDAVSAQRIDDSKSTLLLSTQQPMSALRVRRPAAFCLFLAGSVDVALTVRFGCGIQA